MHKTKKENRKILIGKRVFSKAPRIFAIFCLVFVSVFTRFTPIQADTNQYLYVSTSGSDSNPGTESQPWRTIQHAVDSVDPGETIFIMGGTYNESIKVQRSGTSTNPIKLTNYNDQTVWINGGSSPALIPYKQLPQYWIVEGLNLKSSGELTVYFDSWMSDGKCDGIDHWTFLTITSAAPCSSAALTPCLKEMRLTARKIMEMAAMAYRMDMKPATIIYSATTISTISAIAVFGA